MKTLQSYKVLTEIEKSYLAGLYDGEGCISIYQRKDSSSLQLRIYLIGTKKQFMYSIYNLLKNSFYDVSIKKHRLKEVYYIWINKSSYLRFIEDIKSYIILKYNNLLLLEDVINNKIDKVEACNKSRILNYRGSNNIKPKLDLDLINSINYRTDKNYNKNLNLSYLAALLDGEGCVCIDKSEYKLKSGIINQYNNYILVFLESTNLEYVKVLQKIINDLFDCKLNIHKRRKNHIVNSDSWALEIGNRKKILEIIDLLKPFTILKTPRLEILKRHILSQNDKEKNELFIQLKKLNYRVPRQKTL